MSEMGLSDFLKQIGATSLSPKLVLPVEGGAPPLSPKLVLPVEGGAPPLASLHARLEAEIESVNQQTQALLQENWPEFEQQFNTGVRLSQQTAEQERLLLALEDEMQGDNAFLPSLLSTLVVHSRLAQAHSENTHALAALSELTALHSSISNLSSNVTAGALPLAVAALAVVRQQLASGDDQWVKGTETWEVLRKWAAEEDARLESALVGALEAAFSFENTAQADSKLVISERFAAAPRGELLSISQIIDTLDQLLASSTPPRKVDSHLARIAKQLHKYFLIPLFESGTHSKGAKTIVYSQNGEERIATLQTEGPGHHDIIATTQQFLSFFATHSSLLPPSQFAPSFTVNFTPPLQSLILSDHLIPSLPTSTATLAPYLPTLEIAAKFERDFLVGSGYLAFLPRGRESSCEEGTVVREWIDRVDIHWARRVGDATFEKVLQVVRGGDWEGQLVDVYVEEEIEVEEEEVAEPKYVEVTDSEAESEDEQLDEDGFQPFGSPTLVPSPQPAPIPVSTAQFSKTKLGTKITPLPAPTLPRSSSDTVSKIASAPSSSARKILAAPTNIPAPAPPSSRPSQPESIQPEEADEEEDPWGLSSSPVDASPNLFPTDPPSLLPTPSAYDNGLLPPVRVRAQSTSSSAGSEDPWGLSADLDLEEQTSAKAESVVDRGEIPVADEIVEEYEVMDDGWGFVEPTSEDPIEKVEPVAEGEDAWGFDESEMAAEEEAAIAEEVLALNAEERAEVSPAKSPSTIPLPFSPAMNAATISPLVVQDSPPSSHAKKDSLGGWGWEDPDDQLDLDAAPPPIVPTSRSNVARAISNGPSILSKPAKVKKIKKPKKMKLVVVPPVVRIKQERRRLKEQLLVSNRSRSIVAVAEEILFEALEVGSQSFRHPTFATASTPLLKSFLAIPSLYRASIPVQHSALILGVPAIGMQLANDAEWIGGEFEKVWRKQAGGRGLSTQEVELVQGVRRMNDFAQTSRNAQVILQRDALMSCLDEASRFLYTADDSRYAACERAIGQVTDLLQRLSTVWKPVMSSTAFFATLGSLVNVVLHRVLNEIEDQVDISEEESIRLNKLCKILHGLEDLFIDENANSSVGREVPIWFKFVFLSELLEASMADILFLFDNSHLVDFTTGEIAKLVRALFSESPLRQKNLEHILAGHPDFVPTEGDGEGWE